MEVWWSFLGGFGLYFFLFLVKLNGFNGLAICFLNFEFIKEGPQLMRIGGKKRVKFNF